MRKPADNKHPIHDLLRNRWSPRAFSPARIEPGKLSSLFEAARWSPSCANRQPWSFLFVSREEPEPFGRLLATLTEKNQRWAYAVPVLVLTVTRRVLEDGSENPWAQYDLGQSVAHLSVEAEFLGLSVHQMAGFDAEAARREFDIPAEFDPVTVFAVGYPGDPEELTDDFKQREHDKRTRKEIEEFVFYGKWNASYRSVDRELVADSSVSSN